MNNSVKIVLVIGGSCGLGCVIVEVLVQCGVNVVLIYKMCFVEVNEVVIWVEVLGVWVIVLFFSVGEIDIFDVFVSVFQGVLMELGVDKFDYLVNNVGNVSGMGFFNVMEVEFDVLYCIYVKSVFFFS